MIPLPIDGYLGEITSALAKARAVVVVAEPGAGKTTRVPGAILKAKLLGPEHPRLVMLQPRRVAARAAAMRIAEENAWELGNEVGYHIRFEKKLSDHTRLAVLTEGILSRQMLSDPFLTGVGAVVLDEFHERSLHTDVGIAMLREMQQTVRPDLLLVVMSATLAAEKVAAFLGGCPIVRVPGRTFGVEIEYRPHGHAHVVERTVEAIERFIGDGAAQKDQGDVLVFLPGAEEIRRVENRLAGLAAQRDLLVLPLHGSLPAAEQTLALRPAQQRKIILATNIAETSLTIDGVTTVIDAGLARVPEFDPRRGLDRLELKRISQASATQRAGRAGRTAPGRCIRLWSEKEQHQLDDFELPEVHRVDLCATVLELHAWGKSDPRDFEWFEKPAEASLKSAERLLAMLGALTKEERGEITEIGKRLMRLAVHPRLGRLLIAAADGGASRKEPSPQPSPWVHGEGVREAATIAAILSEKDILRRDYSGPRGPVTQGDSDLLVRVEALEFAEKDHFRSGDIDPSAARQAAKARDELLRVARRLSTSPPRRDGDGMLKLLLLAYPDRVCRRRNGDTATMVGGGGVKLAPESVVRRAEYFLALDARHDPHSASREAMVRIASAIEVQWLYELFPASIRRVREVVYNAERDRVVGMGRTYYRDLILAEDQDAPVEAAQAGGVLAEALQSRAVEIFEADEKAGAVLARVELLRANMSGQDWPKFDAGDLGDILREVCRGRRSLEEVKKADLAGALLARLVYPLDRLLQTEAPETIEVPSGNRIAIKYAKGQQPVLAVRLQELFGWVDTPRIAGGRVAVVVHLLGPNYRPVQITDDLRSFWKTTYFQVRKDLRVRYPKHSWPEDPLTAQATARGGRRK